MKQKVNNKQESLADARVTRDSAAAYIANALEVRQGIFAIKVELVSPRGKYV